MERDVHAEAAAAANLSQAYALLRKVDRMTLDCECSPTGGICRDHTTLRSVRAFLNDRGLRPAVKDSNTAQGGE